MINGLGTSQKTTRSFIDPPSSEPCFRLRVDPDGKSVSLRWGVVCTIGKSIAKKNRISACFHGFPGGFPGGVRVARPLKQKSAGRIGGAIDVNRGCSLDAADPILSSPPSQTKKAGRAQGSALPAGEPPTLN